MLSTISAVPCVISKVQRGTLGLILFNVYINYLHRSTTVKTVLFADDTLALNSGNNLPALIDSPNKKQNVPMVQAPLLTVARQPKFRPNNTKPAIEKNPWPRALGGRTAASFWQK